MSQIVKDALKKLGQRQDLTADESREVFLELMSGGVDDVLIASLLMGLAAKGETPDEVFGAAQAMRAKSVRIAPANTTNLVDTCGTGGDGKNTFNISTAAAIVAATGGATVAKHGNRAASSKCGSADVLEDMGVNISLTPEQVEECINQVGIGFLFAPTHHPAMKYVINARKQLGIRTIFNLLGPLTNPAGVRRQLVGAYSLESARLIAEALRKLDCVHALVVHSKDGMDEISVEAPTHAFDVRKEEVKPFTIEPAELLELVDSDDTIAPLPTQFTDKQENIDIMRLSISYHFKGDPVTSLVLLNAGATFYVSGISETIHEGVKKAIETMNGTETRDKLDQWIKISQELGKAG